MSQVQKERSAQKAADRDDTEQVKVTPSAAARSASDIIDSLIDEIDAVLEENAEEFVKAFVQQEGQ